jgi:hypothetical protein
MEILLLLALGAAVFYGISQSSAATPAASSTASAAWIPAHSALLTSAQIDSEIGFAKSEKKDLFVKVPLQKQGDSSTTVLAYADVLGFGLDVNGTRYFDVKINDFDTKRADLPAVGTIARVYDNNLAYIGRSLYPAKILVWS